MNGCREYTEHERERAEKSMNRAEDTRHTQAHSSTEQHKAAVSRAAHSRQPQTERPQTERPQREHRQQTEQRADRAAVVSYIVSVTIIYILLINKNTIPYHILIILFHDK
jgi:cation transport ATPase